ncbi:MAG: 2-oxoisovalerate dehydrogenase component alpha subunit [Gaiellaceae bacterium]|nr:2-oxoisovalerate dehydrogenase component alpha subunit [Gaiellaceae bacterium]
MDDVVATFEVRRRRFLAPDGTALGELPAFADRPGELLAMYRAMLRARAFDARCTSLQRTGRLGTFATALGQEAVPVGVAAAMRPDDVLVPSYREAGAQLWRGVEPAELLAYWGGDERGHDYAAAAARADYPVCITVGNQALHAAGVAVALQHGGEGRAVVCTMGDGATSKGDVYEAINVAGAWRLPLVLVITNNRWAISTPVAAQTGAATLAQKGLAGGLAVLQTDGNDVLAVRDAVEEALARARAGDGATVIECLTYRVNDHNTADDARRYRDAAEVEEARATDPVDRLRGLLVHRGETPDDAALDAAVRAEMDAAVAHYEAAAAPDPDTMFAFVHATPPAALRPRGRH